MKSERGFTLVEVMIAMMLLATGILGLLSTMALTTRMIARGQRSAMASSFASQRLERLRSVGCVPASRVSGTENLTRGSVVVARNDWRYVAAGDSTHRVYLTVTYLTRQGRQRTDSMETVLSCQL